MIVVLYDTFRFEFFPCVMKKESYARLALSLCSGREFIFSQTRHPHARVRFHKDSIFLYNIIILWKWALKKKDISRIDCSRGKGLAESLFNTLNRNDCAGMVWVRVWAQGVNGWIQSRIDCLVCSVRVRLMSIEQSLGTFSQFVGRVDTEGCTFCNVIISAVRAFECCK